jgi:hypothetical protein
MDYCYIKFSASNSAALSRTQQVFDLIRKMKSGEVELDEARITASLTEAERSYFWSPSPEEMAEWNAHWQNTPVAIRTSSSMVVPQWDIESMYEALWNGEYELVGIIQEQAEHYLAFNPAAYPYGGVSSMIAFVECFGHRVVGYDDGTGYVPYQPRAIWRPSSWRREA